MRISRCLLILLILAVALGGSSVAKGAGEQGLSLIHI